MSTVSRADQHPGPRAAHPRRLLKSGSIRQFQRSVAFGDLAIIAVAVVVTHLSKFGFTDPAVGGTPDVSYVPLSILLALVWWGMLLANHTYRRRLLGSGVEEYQRVFQSTFMVFGAVAILSYLLKIQVARSYFLLALPIGLFGILLWRWLARKQLIRRRSRNELCDRVVILGGQRTASDLAKEFARHRDLGYQVVGCCLSEFHRPQTLPGTGVAVLGGPGRLAAVVKELAADTVVITGSHDVSPSEVRELSWSLDPERTKLVLAPSVVDVAGPRIHLRPVDGLSLVEVEMPRFDGAKLLLKRAFDLACSGVLLVLLLPVWILVPLLIWLDDRGPAFFRQTRVGLNGRNFAIWKFRSMRINADAELASLLAAQGTADKPLFKVEHDPRITKLGAFMRRTSIDELPQLFNVFNGTMSLVGPRPQVPAEVALYDNAAARRLFVKPGVTGLWQVSGRSNLTWEEAVRFDLFYVENWSLTGDIQILFRTIKVVFAREGAG